MLGSTSTPELLSLSHCVPAPRQILRAASHGRDGRGATGEQTQQKTRSSREERRERRDEGKRPGFNTTTQHLSSACVKTSTDCSDFVLFYLRNRCETYSVKLVGLESLAAG